MIAEAMRSGAVPEHNMAQHNTFERATVKTDETSVHRKHGGTNMFMCSGATRTGRAPHAMAVNAATRPRITDEAQAQNWGHRAWP